MLKTKTSSGKPVAGNIWSCSLLRIKVVDIVIFFFFFFKEVG